MKCVLPVTNSSVPSHQKVNLRVRLLLVSLLVTLQFLIPKLEVTVSGFYTSKR